VFQYARPTVDDETTLQRQASANLAPVLQEAASLILQHPGGTKVVPLHRDAPVVVGRAFPADAVVEDASLSRQHARFTWRTGGLFVEDLGSTNGTLVNGARVDGAQVAPGDSIVMGAITASMHVVKPRGRTVEGIEVHDRFALRLREEVVRARSFGRKLALLMVRANTREADARWAARIRGELRDVDVMSAYGPAEIWLLLPEATRADAERTATQATRSNLGEPTLRCGGALFPDAGGTADKLIQGARQALRRTTADERVAFAAAFDDDDPARDEPLIVSPAMHALFDMVQKVARSTIHVLIHGETGTGKELIARAIHQRGPRAAGPMRAINCGAIPPTLLESVLFGHEKGAFTGADATRSGLFEQAAGGTVFLDEVGELPAPAQAALLRVLETRCVVRVGTTEERPVDVRVVAATHRDLEAMAKRGDFRLDLFYRLNGVLLEVPPLRDRREEILPLAEHFLREASAASGAGVTTIDPGAGRRLRDHSWPGNVRELRNVIERAVVLASSDAIEPGDLPDELRRGLSSPPPAEQPDLKFKDRIKQYELELIVDALERSEGNQTAAAKLLGMPLRTLVHKIKSYGIKKKFGV